MLLCLYVHMCMCTATYFDLIFSIACYFYALQLQMHVCLICAIKFYLLTYSLTWPTSVCRRRLRMVVASLALQSPGPSWCSPGFGRLLATGIDYQQPSNHQNCRLLHSSAIQDPPVPALDSAAMGCRVPSSGAVVTVQGVLRRLQMSRLD